MTAFVFPGQGSHKVGMGAELADASVAAREVFEEVDEALGQNLSRIMREGPEEQLMLTANAQPAIMANAIAVLRVLEREAGLSIAAKGECVAGHSLGEYTALCAAGAFSLADTARLLRLRGQAMQAAVPVGVGAMCALLGADLDKAQALAEAAARRRSVPGRQRQRSRPGRALRPSRRDRARGRAGQGPRHQARRDPACLRAVPLLADAARRRGDGRGARATPPGAVPLPLYANVTAARVTDPAKSATCWSSRSPAASAGARACSR